MCKKQSSVSHISTEPEVISLDASLRMDGTPALDLLDLVIEELHSSSNQPRARDNLYRDTPSENVPTKERISSLTRRKILGGQM